MTRKAFLMADAALRRRDFTRAFALSHSTLTDNLLVTSARFPDVAAIHFLGTSISYRDFTLRCDGCVDSLSALWVPESGHCCLGTLWPAIGVPPDSSPGEREARARSNALDVAF